MGRLKGTQTEKNLLTAFCGESQARNRYTYFAKQAKKEGYVQISHIFEETADHEMQHAKRYFKSLEGGEVEITAKFPAGVIGTTLENLKEAAAGEHHETAEMYPGFAEIAEKEGFRDIAAIFRMIAKAESFHERRYRKLIERIEKNEVFKRNDKVSWKCSKCGYVHDGNEPPKNCPACTHEAAYFGVVDSNW